MVQMDELWKLFGPPVNNSRETSDIATALDSISCWGRKQGKLLASELHLFSFSFKEWKLLLQGRRFLNNV